MDLIRGERDVAEDALDAETARAHRLEVRAAGDEVDLLTRACQPGAEGAAEPARTDHRDPHSGGSAAPWWAWDAWKSDGACRRSSGVNETAARALRSTTSRNTSGRA